MRIAGAMVSLLLLSAGAHASPQGGAAAADERVVVSDQFRHWESEYLYLKGNRFCSDRGRIKKDHIFLNYTIDGRDYRKLPKAEAARHGAGHRVRARRLGLYLDGRRVRTNVLWVSEVLSAYHWNGGVIVSARTSRWHPWGHYDIGFIDPQTNRCVFAKLEGGSFETAAKAPDFLVPVALDEECGDLALDVEVPARVLYGDGVDVTVTLTNVSDGPLVVPHDLFGGLGIADHVSRKGYVRAYAGALTRGHHLKAPECSPPPPGAPLLMPSEKRSCTMAFGRWDLYRLPGRNRLAFYWDGFVHPGDGGRMSRFFCDVSLDVGKPVIDASRGGLVLRVAPLPGTVSRRRGRLDIAFSLTNVSGGAMPVPDSLEEGFRTVEWMAFVGLRGGPLMSFASRREMQGHVDAGREVVYVPQIGASPVFLIPHQGPRSPLRPGERREGRVSLDAKEMFAMPGRYLVEFHWDCLMDPDDRASVTRFTAKEKWAVEVTE